MGALIGDLLPLAVGIPVSPVPVIATILMLLAPRAGRTSSAFLLGWVAGIAGVTIAAALIAGAVGPGSDRGPSALGGWIKLVLGILLLVLAGRQWRGRARDSQEAEAPRWMAAIDTVTPGRALGLAAGLAALIPKNLLLGLAAGSAIGEARAGGVAVVLPTLVFVIIAAITVVGPVVAYLLASNRLRAPLADLQTWLQTNNAAVMTVLFLVLGASLFGKGLGQITTA